MYTLEVHLWIINTDMLSLDREKPCLYYACFFPDVEYCQAWKALEGRRKFDPALFAEPQLVEIKRCIQIGLLCAQHESADRPTMEDVLLMLNGEKELPTPKKPAYIKWTA